MEDDLFESSWEGGDLSSFGGGVEDGSIAQADFEIHFRFNSPFKES